MSPVSALYDLQMLGNAVFAATGVLAVNRRGLDVFGGVVLGTVTALGGGTIRDLIVSVPVFWLADTNYLLVGVASSVIAFFAAKRIATGYQLLLYLDAVGIALVGIQATEKVLGLGHGGAVAVAMGVLSGIGGGLLRDVLAARPTLLMSREIYATPILIGCVLSVGLRYTSLDRGFALAIAAVVIFLIRAAAIRWHVQMPGWLTSRHDPQ
jgi:uncharacterized membrane protein YeiH